MWKEAAERTENKTKVPIVMQFGFGINNMQAEIAAFDARHAGEYTEKATAKVHKGVELTMWVCGWDVSTDKHWFSSSKRQGHSSVPKLDASNQLSIGGFVMVQNAKRVG